jgi:hypothetical protein
MDLDSTTRWRDRIGKAAAFFCMVFLLASFDGLAALFRQPVNTLELLPGQSVPIDGNLSKDIESVAQLEFAGDSALMWVSFEGAHAGFWLGELKWRVKLTVSPAILPGEYRLSVDSKGSASTKPLSVFQIKVYKDYHSLREGSKSFLRRYLGFSPWVVFACFLMLACMAFGGVYRLSHRRDVLLAQQGKAEIYRISKIDGGCEVAFGLGTIHGVEAGMQLALLTKRGDPAGHVQVREAYEADSVASAESACDIERGCLVAKYD